MFNRARSTTSRRNWPLTLGMFLVILILSSALLGPVIAPRPPLEETIILQIDTSTWIKPPFPMFTPGYPLGSDLFGRDLLSRLLWAIRPTLVMVSLVAGVRLVLGMFLGMLAGWSNRRLGKMLDTLISGALAIPVLMTALIAIAAIGADYGLWAFVIGLAITGWAETAQTVREQTRIIKGELYIEAARALGASNMLILLFHVLRQLMPLFWMLFALEISNTLTVTAGLGFLGYFIGGDAWIEVGDFVARRVSQMPELGQMLATSQTRLDQPWPLVAVGTVIFTIVLGFNLLAEGLRRQVNVEQPGKRSLYGLLTLTLYPWVEVHIWAPVRAHPRRVGALLLIGLASVSGLLWWSVVERQAERGALPEIPGAHLWAAQYRDPWSSLTISEAGPVLTPTLTLLFEHPAGLSGGPAITADGTFYVTAADAALYALAPDGAVLWRTTLFTEPVGTPALDAAGRLYVSDRAGGLTALTAAGAQLWRYQPEPGAIPASGPMVALDGNIYYAFGSKVQALDAAGEPLWRVQATYAYREMPPSLSITGDWLFWGDVILNRADGAFVDAPLLAGASAYFNGGDAHSYMLSGHTVMQWQRSGATAEVTRSINWDSQVYRFRAPVAAGVNARQQVWLLYSAQYGGTNTIWLDMQGRILSTSSYSQLGRSYLIGVDARNTHYLCGPDDTDLTCVAMAMDNPFPNWSIILPGAQICKGGALIENTLYVVTREGQLYRLSN